MAEEPLRDYEIQVLRGMIDEHRHNMEKRKYAKEFWTTGRIFLVAFGALTLFVLQVIVAILTIRHG